MTEIHAPPLGPTEQLGALRRHLPRVVAAAVDAFDGTADYHAAEGLRRAAREAVRDAVHRQLELCAAGTTWSPEDLARLSAPMLWKGRLRVPHATVERVTATVQHATHCTWWSVTDRDDVPALLTLGGWSAAHSPVLLDAFAAAYRDGLSSGVDEGQLRSATCRALVDGTRPPARAVPVERAYSVVALLAEDEEAAAAAHRELERSPELLACTTGPVVTLLVPGSHLDEGDVLTSTRRLHKVRRAVVTGAVAPQHVPAAHRAAEQLATLAEVAGDPRPLLRAGDLGFDELVARHRPAVLDRLLEGIGPELVHTLDVLYRFDLDRPRTARTLHVHRNTVDYRLRRVEALTGVSPTSVRGIQLFATALAARRLEPDGSVG